MHTQATSKFFKSSWFINQIAVIAHGGTCLLLWSILRSCCFYGVRRDSLLLSVDAHSSLYIVKRLVTYSTIFLNRKSIKHGKDVIVLPLNAVLLRYFRDAIGTNLISFSTETLLAPMFWHRAFSSSLWGPSVPGSTRTKSFCNYWSCHWMLIASDLQGCL